MGGDHVVALRHMTGRARLSGVEAEIRFAVGYTLRDGKIVRGREYGAVRKSLEASGWP